MKLKQLCAALFAACLFIGSAVATPAKAKSNIFAVKRHCSSMAVSKTAPVVPSKLAYAWATRDRGNIPTGLVSFSLDKPNSLTSLFSLPELAFAGCYGDGKYFFDRYRSYTDNGESTWAHIAFSSIDLSTGKITDVKDWSDEVFIINDMTYDYTTGLIYAVCRNIYQDDFLTSLVFEYSSLVSINPSTGIVTELKQFIDWNNGLLTSNPTYYTIACDLNGDLYTIDKSGYLIKFDKKNEYAEIVIGSTGLVPGSSTQSMEFDHTTGALYWCADYASDSANLVLVDTESGLGSVVGDTGTDSHLVGLYIPFNVPNGAAPGAVTNYSAVSNATGEKSIKLTWTNPTLSFGKNNLFSLSSVKVYRNESLVKTFTSVTPGEEMSFEDTVDNIGLYSYSVVAVNSAGEGLSSALTRWVGKDLPQAVSNLGIGMNDNGGAYLKWNAPTKGMHNGVIDDASLGYKIVRFPDGVILAEDFKGNEYYDNTVTAMSRYYYTVESHTADGVGDLATSVEIALGSSIDSYPWNTLFADVSEFDLWTVLNPNDGSAWNWKSRTAGGYSSFAMYQYDNNNTADDYLVSPDLLLKKGGKYKLRFAYSGSNANFTEKLEVTFGKGKTVEAQSQSLKQLTFKTGDIAFCDVELPEVEETGYYNISFHAMSAPKMYNIYITDVTFSMTVAPPDDPTPGYTFDEPKNLKADVDNNTGAVTLSWNNSSTPDTPLSSNISEDFEGIEKWTVNPAGSYDWQYIDGDKGIPYRSDYADMPYPTDGTPLAAMIMAPNDLDEAIYSVNPPHSGDQYLLFKSNFSKGDGTRPAPAPDDWFISPALNFDSDFIFRFYCKADPDNESKEGGFDDLWNTEQFRVGFSTTDANPESFTWFTNSNEKVTTSYDEWVKKEYSVPATAKYVCIHYCTPTDGYWFMVDDVFIGNESSVQTASLKKAENAPTFKCYDVFVDDVKKASTQETSYVVNGLEKGNHVAKVVAVYEEGESKAAATSFVVNTSGVETVSAVSASVYPNPASEIVNFNTTVDDAILCTLDGATVASVQNATSMNLNGIVSGVYILKIKVGDTTNVIKLVVK